MPESPTDPLYPRRWEDGIDHHPLSEKLMDHMMKVDWENGDGHCLKKGGDGDNGENLMFLMDGWFERCGVERDDGTIDLNSRSKLERAIAGALKSCIHDHGPITTEGLSSATKRVIGALKTFNAQHHTTAKERK